MHYLHYIPSLVSPVPGAHRIDQSLLTLWTILTTCRYCDWCGQRLILMYRDWNIMALWVDRIPWDELTLYVYGYGVWPDIWLFDTSHDLMGLFAEVTTKWSFVYLYYIHGSCRPIATKGCHDKNKGFLKPMWLNLPYVLSWSQRLETAYIDQTNWPKWLEDLAKLI